MFKRYAGKTQVQWLPVTASTPLAVGALLTFSGGLLVAATSATAAADIVGVNVKPIVSTDSDYATSGRLIPVEVPAERCVIWEADVTSGLVAADILKEVDLTDASTVNRGAVAVKAVRCMGVISTTKGYFMVKFHGAY